MSLPTFVSLAAAASSIATMPSESTLMRPDGPWRVEKGNASCTLSRSFSSDVSATTITLDNKFDALDASMLLLTTLPNQGQTRSGKAKVSFIPTDEDATADYIGTATKDGRYVARITIARADWSSLVTATELRIKAPPVSVDLQWLRYPAARAALEKCEGELKESWGVPTEVVPPDRQAEIVGNAGSLFGASAYPRAALKANIEGTVALVLIVDDDGTVSNCKITASANSLLDLETCVAARMIRFKPAKNAAGTHVRSVFPLKVHWLLPQRVSF